MDKKRTKKDWLCNRWILSFHLGFQPTDNAEDKDGCKSTSNLDYHESYRRLDCHMKGEEEGSRISKERSFQYHLSWSAFWSTQWLVLYQPSTRLPKKACRAGTFWRLRKRIKSHVLKAMNERMALYRLSKSLICFSYIYIPLTIGCQLMIMPFRETTSLIVACDGYLGKI